MIFIKFTLKMDENYFSNFFHTIFRVSEMPLLYFQNLKKMTYKSANSNKGLRPKMFLIGHRNSFLPNTWKPICNCPHFDKKSVSNRPTAGPGVIVTRGDSSWESNLWPPLCLPRNVTKVHPSWNLVAYTAQVQTRVKKVKRA